MSDTHVVAQSRSRAVAQSRSRAVALAVFCACMSSARAEAAIQQTRICVDLDLGDELYDASPRPALMGLDYGEDYGRYEGTHPFPAQRWLARVLDENGSPIWGYAPLDADGCTGATDDVSYDDTADELSLELVNWAYFETGDRSIIGLVCSDMFTETECVFELERLLTPVAAVPSGVTWFTIDDLFGVRDVDYPLWAASFCEERLPLNTGFEAYLLQDQEAEVSLATAASKNLGGAPTIAILGSTYRSKFTACHEMGHVQTNVIPGGPFPMSYTHNPSNPSQPLADDHSWGSEGSSPEWQSAAAVEGFANVYALWAFNDIDATGSVPYVKGSGDENTYEALPVPIDPAACWESASDPTYHLAAGVSNEANWTTALRAFRTDAATPPSAEVLFGMLARAYDDGNAGWVTDEQDSSFWDNVVAEMEDTEEGMQDPYLTVSQVSDWEDAGADWCLDH